ncbi:MAG TPA: hypothetical protein VFF10_06350 [Trueperaceae bacterium]|nr:hypothetical protein [Trueperaceae bacterium]
MRFAKVLLLPAAILLLAACTSTTQPPVETPEYLVEGKLLNAGDVPMPNVASFIAIHPGLYAVSTSAIASQAVEYDGILAISSSQLEADGSFEWDLGDGSDIPAAYLTSASQAFQTPAYNTDTTCSSTASAAVSVLRSFVLPDSVVPAGALGPLTDSLNFASGIVYYTDAASLMPLPAVPYRLKTWVFAEGDVSIEGACVFDDGMNPVAEVATIDLDLVEGWNEVTANIDPVSGTSVINNESFEGAWLASIFGP